MVTSGPKKPTWERTKTPHLYRHRNRRYYLRTFFGGKEKWTSLKTTILAVAKQRLKEHEQAADARRLSGIHAVSGPLSYAQALAIFRHGLAAADITDNTRAFYQNGIKLVERTWENIASAKLDRITALDVVAWLQAFVANAKPHVPPNAKSSARGSTGASKTTVKCALISLRKLLDVVVATGHLPANPARNEQVALKMRTILKKMRREKTAHRRLVVIPSTKDLSRLVSAVREAGVSHCRAAADYIEFLAYCGARKNEAVNVLWQDIDFARGNVCLRVTKNGDQRDIPMFINMRRLLKRLKRERVPLRQNDPVLLVKDVQGFITSACRKLGITRFTTHGLRHFFGTACLEEGIDARTVAKWLGHADNGALLLEVYAHIRPDHEKRMMKRVRFTLHRANSQP